MEITPTQPSVGYGLGGEGGKATSVSWFSSQSPSFFSDLGVCRALTLPFSHSSLATAVQHF